MPRLAATLFLAQLSATVFMTGLIWFVQIVHYPLFAAVDRSAFTRYAVLHASRTGWVVGPPMLVEAATSLLALVPGLRPPFVSLRVSLLSAILVILLWSITGLVQVPLHNTLARGYDPGRITRLVRTNWLRTLLWTARSALLLSVLIGRLR